MPGCGSGQPCDCGPSAVPTAPRPAAIPAKCFKCGERAPAVPSRDGAKKPYCLECFVGYVDSTFRDAFFRHCGVPSAQPLVLAVSGGPSSMAMLRMAVGLRDGAAARGGQGRIVYDLTVVHLDETGVCTPAPTSEPHDDVCRQAAAAALAVRSECDRLHVPCRVLPLADLMADGVVASLRSRAPLSDREDALYLARRGALLNAASALGASGLLLGDSAVTAAWRTLSEIVRGRGGNIIASAGYCARVAVGPQRELFVFRPMRGVLAAESVLYCRAQSLPTVWQVGLSTLSSQRSIDRCLEAFVATLAVDFRATVFNVLNTVTKLSPTPRPPDPKTCKAAGKGAAGRLHAHEVIHRALRDATDMSAPLCPLCALPRPRRRPDLGGDLGVDEGDARCYGCAVLAGTLGAELSALTVTPTLAPDETE